MSEALLKLKFTETSKMKKCTGRILVDLDCRAVLVTSGARDRSLSLNWSLLISLVSIPKIYADPISFETCKKAI